MKLKPIREWQEKEGKRVLPTIRLYIGKIHVATVRPTKSDPDLYHVETMLDILLPVNGKQTLADIKMDIELTLSEFIKQITVRNLRKISPTTNTNDRL